MNIILRKTPLLTLSSSTHKFRNVLRRRVLNPIKSSARSKDTLIFLQNGFSRVSFGCTTAARAPVITSIQKRNCPAESGSGAGKGGETGRVVKEAAGAVKEAGGSLDKYGAAMEDQFFHNKSKAEIERLKLKKKKGEKSDSPEKKE